MTVATRTATRARLAGRAPRLLFAALACTLALVGVRSLLTGVADQTSIERWRIDRDLGAEAFAERFVRAYLTWDAARPLLHERAVSAFTSDALEPGAGLQVPRRGAQHVVWTASIGDERVGRDARLITVAAETDNSPYYVSVPVQRDRRGAMAISRYPALVGPPPVASDVAPRDGAPVADAPLESVVRRAIRNYLGRQAVNLRADLDPHAVVPLPTRPMRVSSIDTPVWVAHGLLAVTVRALAGGVAWTLTYAVRVIRRERWYVRAIATVPKGLR
jgi:hypothetical protein